MQIFEPVFLDSEAFSSPLLGVHLRVCRFVGLFHERGENIKHAKLKQLKYSLVLLWAFKYTFLMLVYSTTFNNFQRGALTWALTVFFISICFWLLTFYFKRKLIATFVNHITRELEKIRQNTDAYEEDLLKKYAKKYNYHVYGTWMFAVGCAIKQIIEETVRLIITPDHFEVTNNSTQFNTIRAFMPYHIVAPHSFFFAQFMPLFATFITSHIVGLTYTFVPALMRYAPYKLDILAHRIETMDLVKVVDEGIVVEDLTENQINFWRKKLCKNCVIDQIKIRWFVEELEAFMKNTVFADFISFSVQFCFAFQIAAAGVDAFYAFAIISVSFLSLWPYHSQATAILVKVEDLRFAIYSCDWYNYPVSLQKIIFTMMYGLRKPLRVRAYFVELNRETFVSILNAGYSYFNIMRSMS